MAIARMKRLRLICEQEQVEQLLRRLTRAGCLELERDDSWSADPELGKSLRRRENDGANARRLSEVSQALDSLKKHAGVKKGLLTPRTELSEAELLESEIPPQVMMTAAAINSAAREIYTLNSEKGRLQAQKSMLLPWQELDIPLDHRPAESCVLLFGTIPAVLDIAAVQQELEDNDCAAQLDIVSSDKDLHYLVLVIHKTEKDSVLELLRSHSFSEVQFKGLCGTAADAIADVERSRQETDEYEQKLKDSIVHYSDSFEALGRAYDQLSIRAQWDDISAALPCTKNTAYLSGWVPEPEAAAVTAIAENCGCAWALSEPEEGDDPPTQLRNRRLVEPFGQVTQLYGMPAYDSIIDPNPMVAISYFIFFGMMFSDGAYGLILSLGCLYFLLKAKPTGAMKRFVTMFALCGISTTLWGAAFGSWFGDIIPVVAERITGEAFAMPLLIDPLSEPITMLIISIAMGIVHLFCGMFLNIIRLWKRRQFLDIICDVVVWYVIIIAVLLLLLGYSAALWVITGGLVLILLTGGRHNKGLGKITGGLGAVYNGLTGNLSDILSYARLMALALSTGVVASVMNTLGNMGGNGVFGWIFLIVIFVIGQTFNFAISILGAFVHSCRLEFVELFGRFYEGGGRDFRPLNYKTKYVALTSENKAKIQA